MTDFSQESGRAGRDGSKASSIVLLRSKWTAQSSGCLSPEREAMDAFLTQEHCSRGVLSQFLNTETDWRWCMQGEEACQVCGIGHTEAQPVNVQYQLRKVEQFEFAGPAEVLRQDQLRDEVLEQYERDLRVMRGNCLNSILNGTRSRVPFSACSFAP
jgi:superfamily II DNA helicase RecQ